MPRLVVVRAVFNPDFVGTLGSIADELAFDSQVVLQGRLHSD